VAVVELTCMAPGKDAADGKRRCNGPLSRRTVVPEPSRGAVRKRTCAVRSSQRYSSTSDRPAADDGDNMAHAADAVGCFSSRVACAAEVVRVAEAALYSSTRPELYSSSRRCCSIHMHLGMAVGIGRGI
jgi:hypothetical protein